MSIENYLIFEAYKSMGKNTAVKIKETSPKPIKIREDENDPEELDAGDEFGTDAAGVELDDDAMTPDEMEKGTKGTNRYGSIYDAPKGQRAAYANAILKKYNKWSGADLPVVNTNKVAHDPTNYANFTGKVDCRGGTGNVKNATFTITKGGRIFFEQGVWLDGEFRLGTFTGVFKNGLFKNALFGGGIFDGGTMDGGVFYAGVFKKGVWIKGDGTNTKVNFILNVTDTEGKTHSNLELAELYNATYPSLNNKNMMKQVNAAGFYYREEAGWLNEEGDAASIDELFKIRGIITTIMKKIERQAERSYANAPSPEMIGRPVQRVTKNPTGGVDVTGQDVDDEDAGNIADIKAGATSSDMGKYSAGGGSDIDAGDDFTQALDQDEKAAEIERKKEDMRAKNKELGLDPDQIDDELIDNEQAINRALTDTGLTDEEPALTTDDPETIRKENIKILARKGKSAADKAAAEKWRRENGI